MLYAGAQSAWAVVFSVACVLITLLFLMPSLAFVPKAVLSATVIVAVMNLFQPRQFLALWRISRAETITAGLTFVITLLNAPSIYWGVLAGVLMTLAHFLYQRLHPRIIEIGLHEDGSLRDRHLWQLPPLAPDLFALRMDAELDFAAASEFERAVLTHVSDHPNVRHVCLFAHTITALMPQVLTRYVSSKLCCKSATSRCTSVASSCRWRRCCCVRVVSHRVKVCACTAPTRKRCKPCNSKPSKAKAFKPSRSNLRVGQRQASHSMHDRLGVVATPTPLAPCTTPHPNCHHWHRPPRCRVVRG